LAHTLGPLLDRLPVGLSVALLHKVIAQGCCTMLLHKVIAVKTSRQLDAQRALEKLVLNR
jgi:hypothetical protein